MLIPILSGTVIVLGVIVVTGFAFYQHGRRISSTRNTELQTRVDSLEGQLEAETERANRMTVRYAKLMARKPLVRNVKTGRMEPYVEEIVNEG